MASGGGIVPVQCADKASEEPKGSYSPTITARLELLAGAAANSQLLVACVHSRVVEMLWAEGGVTPSQISVDEVVA